jgi:tRNA wybutosine-synthesizing protein 1
MNDDSNKSALPQDIIKKMERIGYRIVGPSKHSAVKICTWTRNSLCGRGPCYKEKFYGIESHRCMEMTPSIPFCTESCQFCWRLRELNSPKWIGPVDPPNVVIDECIKARRGLLQGFAGNPDVACGKIHEAERPTQVAISLDGEPMLYPHISELVEEILTRKMTAFLVTNGTLPNAIGELNVEPTNLYVTLAGPNESVFRETARPLIPDAWKRLMESLALLKNLSCTTVVRLTLVRELNMVNPEQYAKMISDTESKYVEVKGFMSVGSARERLPYTSMPLHGEIQKFAEKISEHSGYKIVDEHAPSRVVLLKR